MNSSFLAFCLLLCFFCVLGKPEPGPISSRVEALQHCVIWRPGVCGAFVLSFLQKHLLFWFSSQPALVKVHLSMLMVVGKWHHPALLPLERGVHTHHYLGSPHRLANSLLSCIPGFCKNPAISSISELSACSVMVLYTPVFCLRCTSRFWNSKLLGLGMVQMLEDPLGKGLTALCLVPVCSRKEVTQLCMGLDFKVKHSQEAGIQVSYPQQMPLLLC